MLKLIYLAIPCILFFFFFVFSIQKDVETNCMQGVGRVVEADAPGIHLIIIVDDGRKMMARSLGSGVVVMPHARVALCYTIDSSGYSADAPLIPIRIEEITYLK